MKYHIKDFHILLFLIYVDNNASNITRPNPYGDSSWGDLLTAFDGNTVTYDTIGNPTDDGTWLYNWEHGRQLASLSDGTTTWTYTYNNDGLRTQRTNGTDTYSYIYNGGQLTAMTKGSDSFYFTYDTLGRPLSFTYNGTLYYYVLTGLGDVSHIVDEEGNLQAFYQYTAWGEVSVTGPNIPLGQANPIIYKGYVYDWETGLYYLQSRYYNPTWGRFINADMYIATGQGFAGNNTFVYCLNSPVMYVDRTGYAADWQTTFLIGAYITTASLLILTIVASGGTSAPVAAPLAAYLTSSTTIMAAATTTTIVGTAIMGEALAASVNESNKSGKNYQQAKNNKQANSWANDVGYESAETLKEEFTSGSGSKFNIFRDKTTNEIVLVKIKNPGKGLEIFTQLFLK